MSVEWPTFVVEIAFTIDPMSSPSWEDVTQYVRGPISIRRGRQRELGRVEAGTASLVLDNRTRLFDPTYESGPYYAGLLPIRRIRIGIKESPSVYQYLFTGFIERYQLRYSGRDSWVEIEAVDGFKLLALAHLRDVTYPEQLTGERINAILNDANWSTGLVWLMDYSTLEYNTRLAPHGDRYLDTGNSRVAHTYYADTTALDAIQEAVEAEDGLFFINRWGLAVFLERHHTTILGGGYIADYDFSNTGSDSFWGRYGDLEVTLEDEFLYNHVVISGTEIVGIEVEDADSIARYFRRTLSISNDLIVSDDEAYQMAHTMLNRYREPRLRIGRMEIGWPATERTNDLRGRLDLGDLIYVKHQPPPAWTGVIVQYGMIQGIQHTLDPEQGTWHTTYDIYALDPYRYWVLDNEYCSLGTLTRLAW